MFSSSLTNHITGSRRILILLGINAVLNINFLHFLQAVQLFIPSLISSTRLSGAQFGMIEASNNSQIDVPLTNCANANNCKNMFFGLKFKNAMFADYIGCFVLEWNAVNHLFAVHLTFYKTKLSTTQLPVGAKM